MPPVLTRLHRRTSGEAPPADPPGEPGHGGGGRWSLLTVAPNQVVAHLIEGCLAQEGIDVHLDASNLSMGAWLYPGGDPTSPVRIYVRRADFPAASLVLHEVEQYPDPLAPASLESEAAGAGAGIAKATLVDAARPPIGLSPWARTVVYILLGLVALATVGALILFGPCASHWVCV